MKFAFTGHARRQMAERGILDDEVIETIHSGEFVEVEMGRSGRRKVFTSGYEREGRSYPHKEVTVVFVVEGDTTTVITAIARYGRWETVT